MVPWCGLGRRDLLRRGPTNFVVSRFALFARGLIARGLILAHLARSAWRSLVWRGELVPYLFYLILHFLRDLVRDFLRRFARLVCLARNLGEWISGMSLVVRLVASGRAGRVW